MHVEGGEVARRAARQAQARRFEAHESRRRGRGPLQLCVRVEDALSEDVGNECVDQSSIDLMHGRTQIECRCREPVERNDEN